MRWIALGLLVSSGVLYLVAHSLQQAHEAWGYVAAFSEAAMVGAIADWFAVVALFRHPLGLPIPHTAIIPSNKDRIGSNLATFICANFLSTQQVLEKIREFGPAHRLANFLSDPRHAEELTVHGSAALHYAFGAFDDQRVRTFFRTTVLAQLEQVDTARVAGHVLAALTYEDRHQRLLEAILRNLGSALNNEALKETMAEIIASEVRYLRIYGLDKAAGRYATARIVAGAIQLVADMAEQPEHPLRLEFNAFVASLSQRLKDDPEFRAKAAALQRELLTAPALSTYLQTLWSDLVRWTRSDLGSGGSLLRDRAAGAIRLVGEKLQSDLQMQAWIDEQLIAGAPRWIERYREDIRLYIIARVHEWNAEDMTRELEHNIGRDLQFIRINGTLVGGLVGLGIHAATQVSRAL
jgi:uncharacterized membrane-anchored protein YjiN (DUF445 family)